MPRSHREDSTPDDASELRQQFLLPLTSLHCVLMPPKNSRSHLPFLLPWFQIDATQPKVAFRMDGLERWTERTSRKADAESGEGRDRLNVKP